MKKIKLQLQEIKVKSFVTIVNKEEQRTAKGGYVHHPRVPIAMVEVMDTVGGSHWTSEKTRATNSNDVLTILGSNNKLKS